VQRLRIGLLCVVCAAAGFGAALYLGPRTGLTSRARARPVVFFRARTARRVVALTLDDGPDPRWTPQVLDDLKKHKAHATFFVIGKDAAEHPDLVHDELAAGDEIGNHTWDHPDLEALTPAQIDAEVEKGSDALRQIGAPTPKYFRPPKGLTDEAVGVIADAHKYRTVFWDVAVEHYVDHAPDLFLAVQTLLAHVRPGSIILAHDGGIPNRHRTMLALPMVLDGLQARGYRVVDVSQLLSAAKATNR
jgi:peptidoglycan/xylan/chitin deacetylase (PgdA/CDA1 family)